MPSTVKGVHTRCTRNAAAFVENQQKIQITDVLDAQVWTDLLMLVGSLRCLSTMIFWTLWIYSATCKTRQVLGRLQREHRYTLQSCLGGFRDLVPLLTCKGLSLPIRGNLYHSCFRSAMLHACECSAPRADDLKRLKKRTNKPADRTNTDALLVSLKIPKPENVLMKRRLHWFGHVYRSDSWINKCTHLEVTGRREK